MKVYHIGGTFLVLVTTIYMNACWPVCVFAFCFWPIFPEQVEEVQLKIWVRGEDSLKLLFGEMPQEVLLPYGNETLWLLPLLIKWDFMTSVAIISISTLTSDWFACLANNTLLTKHRNLNAYRLGNQVKMFQQSSSQYFRTNLELHVWKTNLWEQLVWRRPSQIPISG